MGKIVGARFPELDAEDQEAVRQHAVAALNLTQKAKEIALSNRDDTETTGNTALIDGVRKFAMDVRELDIDLIDRINPFGEAYSILAKTMSEESLRQVQAVISAKKKCNCHRMRRAILRSEPSSSSKSEAACRRLLHRTRGKRKWPKVWLISRA